MRSIFALALIGAVAYASIQDDDNEDFDDVDEYDIDENFLSDDFEYDELDFNVGLSNTQDGHVNETFEQFAARCSKNYTTNKEYKKRKNIWKKSVKRVAEMNTNASGTAAHFEINCLADQKDDELSYLFNGDDSINNEEMTVLTNRCAEDDSIVCSDQTIDWVAKQKVHPVKNQGSCGSCWAFAAVLALESRVAIDNNTDVVALSEQQGVDCTTSNWFNQGLFNKTYGSAGCRGGWMSTYWNFAREQGAMLAADYPYNFREQQCQHDASKVAVKAGNYVRIGAGAGSDSDVQSMKDQLQQGPFTIGLQANHSCFLNYTGGILSSKDCPYTRIDHAVTVVGLGKEVTTYTTKTPNTYRNKCYVRKRTKQCKQDFNIQYKRGRRNVCCKKVLREEGKTTTWTVDQEYWLVQNSWGTWWGDNGFIKLAVEGGVGVLGMNGYAETIEVQSIV